MPDRQPPGQNTTIPLGDGEDASAVAPRLLVLGEGTVTTFVLPEAGQLTIGRADDADVRIDRESISRRHAVLHVGERLELEDVGSSNGTRVGGTRLEPKLRVQVEFGDLLEVGGVGILVQGPLDPDGSKKTGQEAMAKLQDVAQRVANSDISALLVGETGVGKEVFARRIHRMSPRRDAPFVPLNCGAFTEQLLESELFGHESGAFTGATATKPGLLETAQGGTIFLDEVGEMAASAQVKLLRVLEERRVLRVGGLQSRPIDVRFVSATNRELKKAVAAGTFREDLYYRLNGITLTIPPLRERMAEIPRLAAQFIEQAAERTGNPSPSLSRDALRRLEAHTWPGNIRELRNVIERAVILCSDGTIEPEHLFSDPSHELLDDTGGDMDERSRILVALQQNAGNQTRAAKQLGISRKTLGVKMDAYGIARPQKGRK